MSNNKLLLPEEEPNMYPNAEIYKRIEELEGKLSKLSEMQAKIFITLAEKIETNYEIMERLNKLENYVTILEKLDKLDKQSICIMD